MTCTCDCHKGNSIFCSSCPDDGHTQQEYDDYFTEYAKKNHNMTLEEFKDYLRPENTNTLTFPTQQKYRMVKNGS